MDITEIKELISRLKADRKVRNQTEFAEAIGYSRTHVSEVINGKEPITPEFEKAIKEAFLNPTNNVGEGSVPDGVKLAHLTEKYEMLKDHHDTIKDILKSNLTSLSTMQLVILAEVKAGLQWEARKLAKGDRKKENQLRGEVSILVGENLRAFGIADKSLQMGRLDS